jgi:hypothetical protein
MRAKRFGTQTTWMLHASIAWMSDGFQAELLDTLVASHDQTGSLLGSLRRGEVDPVELVARLESLALLDSRMGELLELARRQASTVRRRDEERSIRQFVLQALAEISVPQTAGFLEDYVYARERVVVSTRGFGALRRDENRAWRRSTPERRRRAYIVPCLDDTGVAVPRWMARSDWPLRSRIALPQAQALWRWTRVLVLAQLSREQDDDTVATLLAPAVRKYALEATHDEAEPAVELPDSVPELEQLASHEAERLGRDLEGAVERVAASFADLEEEKQLWGATGGGPARAARQEGAADA